MTELSGFKTESGFADLERNILERGPSSGVRDISASDAGGDRFEREEELEDTAEVFVFDFPDENVRGNVGGSSSEESAPQSWIGALISRVHARISTPPPKPVVKEIIPSVEQDLALLLEIEKRALETFASIVENRELLALNALAAGMSPEDIRSSDDPRFQSVLTDAWKARLQQKREAVEKLTVDLEKKRAERVLRRR